MEISRSDGRKFGRSWPGNLNFENRRLRWLECACWIAGLAAVGWVVFVLANTLYFQALQSRRLADLTARNAAPAELHAGDLFGKLTIARIGLSAVVIEGDDDQTLRHAVGHIPGPALPGDSGTVALAGHRDTFFRKLGSLRENDVIVLETRNATHRYRVSSTAIVDAADVNILQSSGRPTLALVTCYPFYFIGPAPRRFVVTAWEVPENRRPSSPRGLYTSAHSGEFESGARLSARMPPLSSRLFSLEVF